MNLYKISVKKKITKIGNTACQSTHCSQTNKIPTIIIMNELATNEALMPATLLNITINMKYAAYKKIVR